MSWVSDILELCKKFGFVEVVYEYEHALKFRLGKVVEKRKKLNQEDLEKIVAEEKEAIKKEGGKLQYIIPFCNPRIPKAYKRSFLNGMPIHPKRFEVKNISPGVYFYFPFIEAVVTDYKQERILNLGNISVPTTDEQSKVITISCNLRYEILDYYDAYTQVHNYEESLKSHTLSVLARQSRGKNFEQWKNAEFITELEKKTLDELRDVATDKWGLKIHEIYITDNVPSTFQRVLYEGIPVVDKTIITPTNQ